jgi:hypothetical protein
VLYLEINQSGDTNGTYTEQNSGWAGQPSLIYSALIEEPGRGGTQTMELIGHGGRIGEPPAIHPDLGGFDTALEQVREIRVRLER